MDDEIFNVVVVVVFSFSIILPRIKRADITITFGKLRRIDRSINREIESMICPHRLQTKTIGIYSFGVVEIKLKIYI